MLSRLRSGLSWLVFIAFTLFFFGVLRLPLAHFQLLPAMLGVHIPVVLAIVLFTWLFGRAYCSVLCPLGIFQDLAGMLLHRCTKHHANYFFLAEKRLLRYGILLLVAASLFGGIALLPVLLDPYSIYGRMVVQLLAPLWQLGVNFFAGLSEQYGVYPLEGYDIVWQGAEALVMAAGYFAVITYLTWRYGRLYCNTICPVGTLLGTISRVSLFRVRVEADKCIGCGMCERLCPASCIDAKTHYMDGSRCVDCFACVSACPTKAIHFSRNPGQAAVKDDFGEAAAGSADKDAASVMSRRALLVSFAAAVGTVFGAMRKKSAGASVLGPGSEKNVLPPGAGTHARFAGLCTGCHLCVEHCPQKVLRPSVTEYGAGGFLQPVMGFSHGYCDYNCTVCGEVCPSSAIQPLAMSAKQQLQIGKAVYHKEQCLIVQEGVECSNCVLHCPVDAVRLVEQDGRKLPKVSHGKCIGCGSCEYHCPAWPRAISVVGTEEQRPIGESKGQGSGRRRGRSEKNEQ